MPYCPNCDMEFVDGITVCSDCGGPLMESEEAAVAARKKEEEEEARRLQQYLADMETAKLADTDVPVLPYQQVQKMAEQHARAGVYVKTEQKYEDLKSSASAFIIVGILMLAASLLCGVGIIPIPLAGITRLIFLTTLTILGILSIMVSISSTRSAKQLAPRIAEENENTRNLIQWFLDSYDTSAIDNIIGEDGLSPEELSLTRFQVIQDLLITHHDLPDQAYVDALSEDIYGRLFE